MTGWSLLIAAGLVDWIATTLVVDSELGRPVREAVRRRRDLAAQRRPRLPPPHPVNTVDRGVWRWADYLLACHLCTGTWVGLAEAIYLGPIIGRGVGGVMFTALVIKALGHLVFELRGPFIR